MSALAEPPDQSQEPERPRKPLFWERDLMACRSKCWICGRTRFVWLDVHMCRVCDIDVKNPPAPMPAPSA